MLRAPCYHQRGSNGTAKCLLLREVISITEDRHPTLRQRDRQPPGYGQNRPLSVGATSFPGQPFVGAGGKHRLRHISLPSAYHRCSGCGPAGGVAALRELCPRRAWSAQLAGTGRHTRDGPGKQLELPPLTPVRILPEGGCAGALGMPNRCPTRQRRPTSNGTGGQESVSMRSTRLHEPHALSCALSPPPHTAHAAEDGVRGRVSL